MIMPQSSDASLSPLAARSLGPGRARCPRAVPVDATSLAPDPARGAELTTRHMRARSHWGARARAPLAVWASPGDSALAAHTDSGLADGPESGFHSWLNAAVSVKLALLTSTV